MLLHPDEIDWSKASTSEVISAARDGIPQAIEEAKKREAKDKAKK